MEYRIAPKQKSKDKAYSILIQKSENSSEFDEQKVKNIAIEYRFFPTLEVIYSFPTSPTDFNNLLCLSGGSVLCRYFKTKYHCAIIINYA